MPIRLLGSNILINVGNNNITSIMCDRSRIKMSSLGLIYSLVNTFKSQILSTFHKSSLSGILLMSFSFFVDVENAVIWILPNICLKFLYKHILTISLTDFQDILSKCKWLFLIKCIDWDASVWIECIKFNDKFHRSSNSNWW